MLAWIEKVVPQPPGRIHVSVLGERDAPAEPSVAVDGPGPAQQLPEGDGCSPEEATIQGEGVGTADLWLLPERADRGFLSWLSQWLQKAIPQLPVSSRVPGAEALEASVAIPEETETQSLHEEEEELAITVLDSEEESEAQCSGDSNALENTHGGKVLAWLMGGLEKIVPQPERKREAEEVTSGRAAEGSAALGVHSGVSAPALLRAWWCKSLLALTPALGPSSSADLRGSGRGTAQSEPLPAKGLPGSTGAADGASPARQSYLSLPLFPHRPGGNGAHSLLRCFLQGLEKAIPQPVTRARQDGQQMKSAVPGRGEETSKGA